MGSIGSSSHFALKLQSFSQQIYSKIRFLLRGVLRLLVIVLRSRRLGVFVATIFCTLLIKINFNICARNSILTQSSCIQKGERIRKDFKMHHFRLFGACSLFAVILH
jgi:hypothetical protein